MHVFRSLGILFAIILSTFSGPALADDSKWLIAGGSGKAGHAESTIFLDISSVVDKGGTFTIWSATVLVEPMPLGDSYASAFKHLQEIDCRQRRTRTISAVFYDTDSNIVHRQSKFSPSWDHVVPGTSGSELFSTACGELNASHLMADGFDPVAHVREIIRRMQAYNKNN